ncbi:MAG: TetR/AcrR family transcriptional regulator [Parvularculaceae bacterium]
MKASPHFWKNEQWSGPIPDGALLITQSPELDDILEKSAKLMARTGYHGASMRDLARVTGRSLSGLYHYFKGKEDLLFLVNQRGFLSLLKMVDELKAENLGPRETLRALISNHIGFFARHLDEMRVIVFGTQEFAPERLKIVNDMKEDYRRRVQEIVGAYIADARSAPIEEADLTRKTFLLFGMMNWIFSWYSSGDHGPAKDLAEEIFQTFTKGCVES